MPTLVSLTPLLAGLGLAIIGLMAFRTALERAYARGLTAGRSEIERQVNSERELLRAASQAALERSNRDVVALEEQRERLQEQLDELTELLSRPNRAGAGGLDADLVRILATIGRSPAAPGAKP